MRAPGRARMTSNRGLLGLLWVGRAARLAEISGELKRVFGRWKVASESGRASARLGPLSEAAPSNASKRHLGDANRRHAIGSKV